MYLGIMASLGHYTTGPYDVGLITLVYKHSVILGFNSHFFPHIPLHNIPRAIVAFFVVCWMCGYHVSG